MTVISVLSHKGGVGKTTLTVNLAVCAARQGLKVLILDMDKQGSSRFWASVRDPDLPPVEVFALDPAELQGALPDIHKSGYQVILIDAPPHYDPGSETIATISDYLLIPSQPSAVDIHAIDKTLALADHLGKPADIVLNNCPHAGTITQDAIHLIFKELEFPLVPHLLHHRIAVSKAFGLGQGVVEYRPVSSGRKAAKEMTAFADWVFKQTGIINKENTL